jgi:S1-C subfamily serine protease
MYRLTVRQLILLSVISAVLAGSIVAIYDRYWRISLSAASTATEVTNSIPSSTEPPKITKTDVFSLDEQNNIQVYDNISPGVVNITSTAYLEDFWGNEVEAQQGTGSGSIIDKKGHILTNVHVIKDAQELTVTLADKSTYKAKVIGKDPDNDLAVIKIDAPIEKLHVVPLGSSQELKIGQKVLAIGNPFGLDRTLTRGIISGLGRPLKTANGRTVDNVIQTDASINPGNSGGPLLNANGEMIGVNTAIYSPSGGSVGIGFAVPVDIAKRVIPELINYGQVLRPWLGIGTRSVTPQLANAIDLGVKEGLIITAILPEGPAGRAGIRASDRLVRRGNMYHLEADVLTKVGSYSIRNEEDLYRALNNFKPTDTVQVEVYRDGQPIQISVKLEPKPKAFNR